MDWKHQTYVLTSRLSPELTVTRVANLLAKAGVQYRIEALSIWSIRTPIALFSVQRTLYSNRNWVGLNPFTFVSGINMRSRLDQSGGTEITLQVNRLRTFLWVMFWVLSSGVAALGMPRVEGTLLFITVSLTAWFALVPFLTGYLIKKEITNCLEA